MNGGKEANASKNDVSLKINVIFGTMAGMLATSAVHPLDVIKVRLQLLSRFCTTREMAQQIVRCRGCRALYAGLSAGLMRQATYTTTRLGVYYQLLELTKSEKNRKPTLNDKIKVGIVAGLAGALAGNPSEVVLVRMMADGTVEPCIHSGKAKLYNGLFHALYRICKEEGVQALWRGGTLTLGRSVFVTIAQLGCYEKAHEHLREKNLASGLSLHVYTSLISSLLTAFLSLPVDLVKTRYQVRRGGVTQNEIFSEIFKQKGILYFWKGFVPYYIRMASHTILSMMALQQFNTYYYSYQD